MITPLVSSGYLFDIFWLPLWYLLVTSLISSGYLWYLLVTSLISFNYPFGIFKLFLLCIPFLIYVKNEKAYIWHKIMMCLLNVWHFLIHFMDGYYFCSGVIVSILASRVVDCGFEPWYLVFVAFLLSIQRLVYPQTVVSVN